MALTISTGFVVDDAIVVIENVTRHLEQGIAPMQAALQGAQEIGFTVLSISISLIAVFIPILLMGGIVGRLFREFCGHPFGGDPGFPGDFADHDADDVFAASEARTPRKSRGGSIEPAKKSSRGMLSGYEHSLKWVLRHSAFTLGILLFTIALNSTCSFVPKGFFPASRTTGRLMAGFRASRIFRFKPCVRGSTFRENH